MSCDGDLDVVAEQALSILACGSRMERDRGSARRYFSQISELRLKLSRELETETAKPSTTNETENEKKKFRNKPIVAPYACRPSELRLPALDDH